MDPFLMCIALFHFWSEHSVFSLRTQVGKRLREGWSAIIANGLPADGWQLILHVPGGDVGPTGGTVKCMLSHLCLVQLGEKCHLPVPPGLMGPACSSDSFSSCSCFTLLIHSLLPISLALCLTFPFSKPLLGTGSRWSSSFRALGAMRA